MFACTMLSSCIKDDVNSTGKAIINVDQQMSAGNWPEGALIYGDDSFYYIDEGIQEMERIDSMLCIYYTTNANLRELPEGYCTVLPEEVLLGNDSLNGVVVLFEGRDRATAIEEMKDINGIFAIQPVYKRASGSGICVASPRIMVMVNNVSDTSFLFDYASQLGLRRIQVLPNEPAVMSNGNYLCWFYVDHSLVNSVVAANMIYEEGNGRILWSYPDIVSYRHEI